MFFIDNKVNNEIVDIFLNDKDINFPFFLIWNNDNYSNIFSNLELDNIKMLIYLKNVIIEFIKTIKKYLISQIYIRINDKPVISITKPLIFKILNETLFTLREKAREFGIGELFILSPLTKNFNNSKYIELFDAVYDLSKIDLIDNDIYSKNILYYSGMIYKNIIINKLYNNFSLFRTSMIEIHNDLDKNNIKDYTLEKYYILNNIIIEWTKINYNKTNGFIFINSWNNFPEGNYMESDKKYGYSIINTFSKALFNIPFNKNNYDLIYLNDKCIIAIQGHVYYEDLIYEVINKTNNIPIKFDLFISTISSSKKHKIEEYIKNYSKANRYEIKIVENKGRDILPFITQMKTKIKNYKYICHIHTKKSKHKTNLGNNWRKYLYENLLGSREVISEILSDFENFEKLGFIFPEVYYDIIKNIVHYDYTEFGLHRQNIKYMNYILQKLFPGFKIGNKLVFPSGNMFWAKVNAIHQIFNIKFLKKFPKELNQTNETIMHAIERIWLYLVKLNGYFYKIIFKHY